MKYLKRFNEELNPETYKKAGIKLANWHNQTERGAKLRQYGHEVAGDLISFWVGEGKSRSTFHLPLEFSFSYCKVKIPGASPERQETYMLEDTITPYNQDKISDRLGILFQMYKDGGQDLYLDVELYFTLSPRQRLLMKDLYTKIQQGKTSGVETGMNDKFIIERLTADNAQHLMTLRVFISESLYWEDDDGNTIKPTEEEIQSTFESMFSPNGLLIRPNPLKEFGSNRNIDHQMMAIPCSRIEGNKLKSNIITKVTQRVKPLIHEIFSEHLQSRPEHFERTMMALTNMKIHDIYRDKIEYIHDEWGYAKQFIKEY